MPAAGGGVNPYVWSAAREPAAAGLDEFGEALQKLEEV
jgi:hypothetical protein